jgi:hypothetical protein
MERFEFNTNKMGFGGNDNLKNGVTSHGVIELYPDFQDKPCFYLKIRGPGDAMRGSMMIDKATAGKLGAALLKWAES